MSQARPAARERRGFSSLYLVDEADKCSGGKLVVIVRDPEHRLLGPFVTHLLGQDATFFGSLMPVVWVVEMRDTGLRPS